MGSREYTQWRRRTGRWASSDYRKYLMILRSAPVAGKPVLACFAHEALQGGTRPKRRVWLFRRLFKQAGDEFVRVILPVRNLRWVTGRE